MSGMAMPLYNDENENILGPLLAAIQKIMSSDDEELKRCVQVMIKAWELLLEERRASGSIR